MKKHQYILILTLAIFASSCSDEIDPDILGYKPNSIFDMVIESYVNNKKDSIITLVTMPQDYFSNDPYPKISGASILAQKNSGEKFALTEVKPGYYSAFCPSENAEDSYSVEISYKGKNYSASGQMPAPVKIDSISLSAPLFLIEPNPDRHRIQVFFADSASTDNYYRMVYWLNSEDLNDFRPRLNSDQFFNGKQGSFNFTREILPTDTLTIVLLSLNKSSYEFYRKLDELSSGDPSFSMPENPEGNFGAGVLGNFDVYAVDTVSYIFQELADSLGYVPETE